MFYCANCRHRIHLSDECLTEDDINYHINCYQGAENEANEIRNDYGFPVLDRYIPSTNKG
jgi:hypothetical protein